MKVKGLFVLIIIFFIGAHFTYGQRKVTSQITSITTLMEIKNKLSIEQSDGYFLKLGFEYYGSSAHGDTTSIRYKKRGQSYESFTFLVTNNSIISANFFTNSTVNAVKMLESAKAFGFKEYSTVNDNKGVVTLYYYRNFLLSYSKMFFEEDQNISFLINLIDRN